jgi:magnesium-protoporphyrin IX monomethyl ester (oxidative) cyclase
MKSDPKLTSGTNVLWIKFFLTAVYATMHVRDHQRPAFHAALGVDPDWYGHEVFTKTSEISKQIFPITLDIEHPRWHRGLKRLQVANADLAQARAGSGMGAWLRGLGAQTRAAAAFLNLLTIPAQKHSVRASTRLEPVY